MSEHFRNPGVNILELTETVQDLLVARATEGLSRDELSRLSASLAAESSPAADSQGGPPGSPPATSDAFDEVDDFELAAAAIELGELSWPHQDVVPEGMSSDLTDRILATVQAKTIADAETSASDSEIASRSWEPRLAGSPASSTGQASGLSGDSPSVFQLPMSAAIGWSLAAGMAMLAAVGWFRVQPSVSDPLPSDTVVVVSAADQYRDLMTAASAVQASWGVLEADAHPDFDSVTGDIVFVTDEQQGVMRFVGLPVNDPEVYQYQLWIADPSRDTEPVDGGVFDVTADGEVFIPVDAKLMALNPAAFVITVEQPGGVVESEPANYRLLAAIAAG